MQRFVQNSKSLRYASSIYTTGVHTKELGGSQLILDPSTNQGMGFPIKVRQMLGMHGLLPPHVATQEEQLERCWFNFNKLEDSMAKYKFLRELRNRNEKLYYKMLLSDLKQLMPIVYTPTVGEACLQKKISRF